MSSEERESGSMHWTIIIPDVVRNIVGELEKLIDRAVLGQNVLQWVWWNYFIKGGGIL